MKKTLTAITAIVCGYLRVNENLFFAAKNSTRITDARKYVSYIAFYKYNIPPAVISGYLGISEKRASITTVRAIAIYKALQYDYSGQIALDIQEIEKQIPC